MSKNIIMPEESFSVCPSVIDEMPAIIVRNDALKKFKHKDMYSWHLGVVIVVKEKQENGMPTSEEVALIDDIQDKLKEGLAGESPKIPNAISLFRLTWNGIREIVFYVHDPEIAHKYLLEMEEEYEKQGREIQHCMSHDKKWKLSKQWMK